ncbi:MAG: mercury methylation corrinoid protein HgcA [Desulfonatronovibrionaceae bacterium]
MQKPPPFNGTGLPSRCCDSEQECCSTAPKSAAAPPLPYTFVSRLDSQEPEGENEPCCGPPPGPSAGRWELPGYKIYPFVTGFVSTPAGWIPALSTRRKKVDLAVALLIRTGFRHQGLEAVTPGLYCLGAPDQNSPVLVTANYRLSLDALRFNLNGTHAWILVLDTRGINVWCAAGKKLFSTQEVIRMVNVAGVDKIVAHRELILPQLAATGVAGHEVAKAGNFSVTWGPVRAEDISSFLCTRRVDPRLRTVTFNLRERAELIPLEFYNFFQKGVLALVFLFFISGIGPNLFSISAAWSRGILAA